MVFLKLVYTEYLVNHLTQLLWVKVVHLVTDIQTLAGHAVGTTSLHFDTVLKTKYFFSHLDFFLLFATIRLEIRVGVQGVKSLWGDCIPADWRS